MPIFPSPTDIAWAAGLFEGEGCFNAHQRSSGTKWQVQVRLGMTDRDVVERFARIVGVGEVHAPREFRDKPRWKPFHEWYVQEAEQVRAVIAMLLPYLGERRTAKALEVDAVAATIRPHNAKTTHCPRGHELLGENLQLEPIKRGDASYFARRCKTCRREQSRNRKRRERAILRETSLPHPLVTARTVRQGRSA